MMLMFVSEKYYFKLHMVVFLNNVHIESITLLIFSAYLNVLLKDLSIVRGK